MTSWRSVRLVMLTLIFMSVVIVIGVIQLFDLSPRSLLAAIYSPRTVLTGTTTPTPVPSNTIRTFEGTPPVVPKYPSVTIMTPEASIFAANTQSTAPISVRARVADAATIVSGGNCIQNDGTRTSFLPDCVINEQGQVVPSQE